MFPTHPAMLDAAAPEAAVKPKPVAADGDVTSAPKVHSQARIAHVCDAHSCSQVDLKPDGEQAKHSHCSTQPQAARTTLTPTSSVEYGSLSMRLQSISERSVERPPDARMSALQTTPDTQPEVSAGVQRTVLDSWEDHDDHTLGIDDEVCCHAQGVALPYDEATPDERWVEFSINKYGSSLLLTFTPEHEEFLHLSSLYLLI